jgi:hypothetical protein
MAKIDDAHAQDAAMVEGETRREILLFSLVGESSGQKV